MDSKTPLQREDLLDKIVAEYADRVSRGEDPRREEVLSSHPEIREDLLRCIRMIEAGAAPAATVASRLAAGVKLGDFTILREVGRGAMGVVYLAEQSPLTRRVALKVMRHHLTIEARHVSRFMREARLAARLRHPNVAAIHAVGEQDGHHYIAMEYLPGPTLGQVIAKVGQSKEPTPAALAEATGNADLTHFTSYPEAAARFLFPIFDALTAAHAAGLVHRDVKPSNILLDSKGNPFIVDFGLAKGEGDIALTMSGEPVGTPYYMAPEQVAAAAKTVDARTDVYSLGVTLYELLTLRRPYEAPSYSELVNKILGWPAPRPRQVNKAVSKALDRVVMCAIAKNPEERYGSVAEFADDLERALTGRSPVAKDRGAWSRPYAGSPLTSRGAMVSGYEYRSPLTVFGLPLLHLTVGFDPRTGRPYRSVGIIAVGNQALGVLAIGGMAAGVVAFGGVAAGLLFACGGAAVGGVAVGGGAAGVVAIGGASAGYYAWGGGAFGAHVLDASHRDPAAIEFFRTYAPFLLDLMRIPRNP